MNFDYTTVANIDTTSIDPIESIDAAMRLIPKGWTYGLIAWPGYDNGKLIDNARVELHHALSSGGGPKVTAYGPTIVAALRKAAEEAHEL